MHAPAIHDMTERTERVLLCTLSALILAPVMLFLAPLLAVVVIAARLFGKPSAQGSTDQAR